MYMYFRIHFLMGPSDSQGRIIFPKIQPTTIYRIEFTSDKTQAKNSGGVVLAPDKVIFEPVTLKNRYIDYRLVWPYL